MNPNWPGGIVEVARLCAIQATLDHHWARELGRAARVSGPGERQRVLLTCSHRHARLAADWEARLPVTDDTDSMLSETDPNPIGSGLDEYRETMSERLALLEGLAGSIDGLSDPSTAGLVASAVERISEMVAEAGRIGV